MSRPGRLAASFCALPPQAAQALVAVAARPWQRSQQRMPQALERPEGCWAWLVLLASVVAQGLTLGFPTCIGIFFTELQREFQASNSETSWFPSILMAMLHAGGKQPEGGPGRARRATTSLASWVPLLDATGFAFRVNS